MRSATGSSARSSSAATPASAASSRCSRRDRKSTRLNSSHDQISYAVFCLKKKNNKAMEEDLVKQGADLSPEAKQEKEGNIRQKLMTYRRHVEELEGEFQTKKRKLLSDFTTKIEHVVREIAEKEQITLVVEKGDAGPGALIMYSTPSINLTDRVIKAFESKG